MADYSRPDSGIVNPSYFTAADSNHIHTTITPNTVTAYDVASNTSNAIQWNERLRLESLDLTSYSEAELRGFAGLLEVYLNEKYPPKPPKFDSIEEADAWMEKHYGQ